MIMYHYFSYNLDKTLHRNISLICSNETMCFEIYFLKSIPRKIIPLHLVFFFLFYFTRSNNDSLITGFLQKHKITYIYRYNILYFQIRSNYNITFLLPKGWAKYVLR